MLYSLDLVAECVVLVVGGETWTVSWPAGFETEVTGEGSVDLIGPRGVVATAGDRMGVNGRERGMHPLCMIGTHFEVTEIVFIDHLADGSAEYATDELMVEFRERPSRADLETFESEYGLDLDHRMYESLFLFRIVDGIDAWEKRFAVSGDPGVRRVNLNWLGTFY